MFPGLSWGELALVGVIAILLFGKRLPEVAKSLGNSYRQFRHGLSEFHSQIDLTDITRATPSYRPSSAASTSQSSAADDYDEPTAPRFEPPPSEPTPPSGNLS